MPRTWDDVISGLAHRAYDGYGEDAGWKDHWDGPMPKWRDLPPETRRHWCAAMAAVTRPTALPPDPPESQHDPQHE
jgi:hypothetical protein